MTPAIPRQARQAIKSRTLIGIFCIGGTFMTQSYSNAPLEQVTSVTTPKNLIRSQYHDSLRGLPDLPVGLQLSHRSGDHFPGGSQVLGYLAVFYLYKWG
jgi:hypothetical protein